MFFCGGNGIMSNIEFRKALHEKWERRYFVPNNLDENTYVINGLFFYCWCFIIEIYVIFNELCRVKRRWLPRRVHFMSLSQIGRHAVCCVIHMWKENVARSSDRKKLSRKEIMQFSCAASYAYSKYNSVYVTSELKSNGQHESRNDLRSIKLHAISSSIRM